ncbi:SRPBCC domain-containing protein [Mucilaginibacter sp. RS28]|uniref:SRPBCC domain-containing protein n=1 Tax=Mucilaginibacter straminoryzae TaxID=2932774 RepID=A0A9X1X583_9SPHI|nr:SRPBCC domain-containing protein [Mucilaginibacter straminoryzae]MCJ8210801.1 SRPBCC domain-containing protein [Mucilaginibacter straminoryzae]
MEAVPFVIERLVNVPVGRVWQAIINREQMKQWYFNIAEFEPKVGFEFEFEGGTEECTYLHKCVITAVEPNRKLSHTWRYEGYDGESEVTWELFAEGDQTRVKLTHTGLETFPPLKDFAKSNFEAGWTYLVGTAIKNFVENTPEQAK